jgi:beta-glucosidase
MPVTIARDDADYPALSLQPDPNGDLRYGEGTRVGYRGLAVRGIAPRQAFGAGFGYTTFALDDAAVEAAEEGWTVSVAVRNTGTRAGAEVVQVYRTVPELTLVGFDKIHLEPGATRRVRIAIDRRRLQTWQGGWTDLPGPVDLFVGRSSADLPFAVRVNTN